MFVVCPKCAAKYQVPLEITLKEGQKLQCSACQHIFHFQKKQEEIQNESSVFQLQLPDDPVLTEEKQIIDEEKNLYSDELPEVFRPLKTTSKQNSHVWLYFFACLFVFILLVIGAWLYRDILKVDYTYSYPVSSLKRVTKPIVKTEEEINIPLFEEENLPKSDFSSSDIVSPDAFSFHSIRFRINGSDLLIEGMIHNNTGVSHVMPNVVYATAYNQQGNILFEKEIFLPNEILPPYGQKAFFGSYSPAPDGIQWIEVSCKR